ncbi:hypothetical protein [Eggerthella sinensis]|uniref:hypothetical protein n=1 Tax=Eggerthella sinensis TaxID=242230 RepID=UPI0022E27D19|nr:hypothetical protein [Eggerthella sinensis]
MKHERGKTAQHEHHKTDQRHMLLVEAMRQQGRYGHARECHDERRHGYDHLDKHDVFPRERLHDGSDDGHGREHRHKAQRAGVHAYKVFDFCLSHAERPFLSRTNSQEGMPLGPKKTQKSC